MMRVLNLYAGIGGNRKLWPENCKVTAVEIDPELADLYKQYFPNDEVIVADAHQYLLDHYMEYDFIWSSPPCPTHSRIRNEAGVGSGQYPPTYPDMRLYQEIIFLEYFFKGKWVVENVIAYYDPLIKPVKCSRHYFWSNFIITEANVEGRTHNEVTGSSVIYGFDLRGLKLEHRKDTILRNLVNPHLALHIFRLAFKEPQQRLI